MKCYYCNNKAIITMIYEDPSEGLSYEYDHCEEHRDLDDHSEEAIELWVEHRKELQE